jgi:hypothetical protein
MKTVWKYDAAPPAKDFGVEFQHEMPVGAKILFVAIQFDVPKMWVEVDPEQLSTETRHFKLVGTGRNAIAERDYHRGSFMVEPGAFVFHVYEVL